MCQTDIEKNLQDKDWINAVESIHEIFDRDTLNGIYGKGKKRCPRCKINYHHYADKAFIKLRGYCIGCTKNSDLDYALLWKLMDTI